MIRQRVNNLYLDSNSIIYDCLRRLVPEYPKHTDCSFEDALIATIISQIDTYIKLVSPDTQVYIAFDGVAPVAKLQQQKIRRYKSILLQDIERQLRQCSTQAWDKTAITPGTAFMKKLGDRISTHYSCIVSDGCQVLVSTSQDPGEGEHKIFHYIRCNPDKHARSVTLIYGLDADLIMLCLNHLPVCPNLFLYRETPEFIKAIRADLEPNASYVLDIPALGRAVVQKMGGGRQSLYDYIFLCFFLGNDFMPHFPSVNIRTNGIDILLAAYRKAIAKRNKKLTDGETIHWDNVHAFVSILAAQEHHNLEEEYKIRDKWSKRFYRTDTIENKLRKLENLPTQERAVEHCIQIHTPHWREQYYKMLFKIDIDRDYTRKICVNYLEGLEWTMRYYTTGCPDWHWKYNYHYAPLWSDLQHYIPRWSTRMIGPNCNKPVTPFLQLAYVLPGPSLSLLPEILAASLLKKYPHNYSMTQDISWSFCKYFWESHVDFPPLDIAELNDFITKTLQASHIQET
ncbi:hypothetical protein [uncultured Mediterranean phage]|nr:hypothetical protein [uncultured Mediterranean phage]